MISVQAVQESQWEIWRSIRLRALSDAPQAFRSTLTQWSGPNDQEFRWRERLRNTAIALVAFDDDISIAMVACDTVTKSASMISAMWVDPQYRGKGVGDLLLDKITQWAKMSPDIEQLMLYVKLDNHHAKALYERSGFLESSDIYVDEHHRDTCEVAMVKHVGRYTL